MRDDLFIIRSLKSCLRNQLTSRNYPSTPFDKLPFLNVLSKGKVPVVVPRLKKFNEHVNDHQMNFARQLVKKGYNLLIVENIEDLSEKISQIKEIPIIYHSNNDDFIAKFTHIVDALFQ